MPTDLLPFPFEDRRAAIAARLGDGILILPSAPERVRSRDTMHRYVADRELYWATGLDEAGACAVIVGDGSGDARFEIFVRDRDPEAELWAGPRLGPEETGRRVGADAAHSIDQLESKLAKLAGGVSDIHFRLGAFPDVEPLVLAALRRGRTRRPRDGTGPASVVDPGLLLDPLRLRKDEAELQRMRRAAEITVRAFAEVQGRTGPGVGEWEVEGWLDGRFRSFGGGGPAYGTIVGGGSNACVLHYVDNSATLSAGDLVLIDAGAEFDHYAADLTRTWPVGGTWTSEQLELYRITDAARAAAIEVCRPGRTMKDVHEAAASVLRNGLESLGIMETDDDPDSLKSFFPHRTAHWLGLDVHDAGDYVVDGDPIALEPGMVLTVEPGLYMGTSAMRAAGAVAEPFEGIGIRIEDDVVVTNDGPEVLTADAPTDPEEVAARIGSRRS
ncbi:MAG TPA: aminopeptidase P N-terminal domain-containing protein [Longimicrobiales bacterium]|nr:aminopeptidase P N-terminal domain-containing protein [Longimicrobiales bacterium]